MVAKKQLSDKIEREYVIPLREKCRVVPRYKKTNKAVKTVKEFLAKHMQVRDKDLNKIKLDIYLNEFLWQRGIRKPPIKVRVKAIKEGDIIRVELVDYPDKIKFKKARIEKREKAGAEVAEKKKTLKEKAVEKGKKEEEKVKEDKDNDGVPDKKEEKEKKVSSEEESKGLEKAAAKTAKHQAGGMTKQPKSHPQRKVLNK